MSSFSSRKRKGTAVLAMLVFALVLLFVGAMFRERLGNLLTLYTESQTKRQAETLAGQVAESLGTELKNLGYIASKIEANPDEMDRLMPLLLNDAGIKQGLLSINGQAVFGDSLSLRTYDGIQASFRGTSAITFVPGQGLLFTCPVFHGENIRYVLYRLFPPETIAERFSIRCYDDIGKALVITRDGDILVPFAQNEPEDTKFMQSEEMRRLYRSMHREREVAVADAHAFMTEWGEMLLFEAEVPGTDYLVAGFVPKEKVSEGIGSLQLLVVYVFGLLMLLVIFGAFYLVHVQVKIRASAELMEAKALAEEASRAKSDFLANMSHEIRTPINAVLGMNEMILRECRDGHILSYSENVKAAGKTLLGIINDILDFSKIEAGKVEIIPVEYHLASVLNDLVNMIQIWATEKGLMLVLDFDRNMPERLFGDEVRIKQIITNILTNAVKYTEQGTVTFSVSCERFQDEPDSVMLRVAVKDTGIGIQQEDKEKLFAEFTRIEEKRNRNVEGTGLGMAITQSLLKMMGTSLQVESTYGSGSVFSFALKQKVVSWEPMGDYVSSWQDVMMNQQQVYREKFTAPEAEVLVVDDNRMNLVVFRNLLKQTKVRIDEAESGDAGLSLTLGKKYDIIFLDHMMPRKDGIETLHELRTQPENPNRETPTVCLTANAVLGARERYIAAGFDGYLSKPIDSGKLENLLFAFLPKEKLKAPGDEAAERKAADDFPEILAPLRDVDWLDLSLGIRNSGSVDGYLTLLRMFCESVDEKAEEIEKLCEKGDFKEYTIKVHALKSSARIIGIEAFAEEAQQMEDAGKNGDTEYIRRHQEDFLAKYRSIKAPLAKVFAIKQETICEDKPEADAEMRKDVLGKIRAAAEEMDCDRLEEIFEEMRRYRIPPQEEEMWKRLEEASEQYDYDEIVALLGKQEEGDSIGKIKDVASNGR